MSVRSTAADLPVVVIGAGPSGLAAAAHLHSRNVDVIVLESGPCAGAAVREWGHVRLFSSWSELVDPVAADLLQTLGWTAPNPKGYPTGADWADAYLQPLAGALGDVVLYGHAVTAVTKQSRDRLVSSGRDEAPFTVRVQTSAGEKVIFARGVIDATGTWGTPNPLGGDGVPAIGEIEHANQISYRIPNFRDEDVRARYVGRHVVVAGTGASAKGALIALTALAQEAPGTRVSWIVRRSNVGEAFAGSGQDELPQRGALGQEAKAAVDAGPVATISGFRTASVTSDANGALDVTSFDGRSITGVDEIIALTGFRPDLDFLSELRLDLDPILQAPRALAPLIDPNEHSCGTVYPHGAKELAQPEVGFFAVGMKSYGRATSFLALTGFEQTRSVAASLAGDHEAAARVELTLPDTGVCGGAGAFDDESAEGGACCAPASAPEFVTLGGLTTR